VPSSREGLELRSWQNLHLLIDRSVVVPHLMMIYLIMVSSLPDLAGVHHMVISSWCHHGFITPGSCWLRGVRACVGLVRLVGGWRACQRAGEGGKKEGRVRGRGRKAGREGEGKGRGGAVRGGEDSASWCRRYGGEG
jgi:hypothetical protein